MKRSLYEVQLHALCTRTPALAVGYEEQHQFAKELGRRWRFDAAWPRWLVAAEVDGGGRQVRWQINPRTKQRQPVAVGHHGTREDYEKLNAAATLGWRVLRFTPAMLPIAAAAIEALLVKAKAASVDSPPWCCYADFPGDRAPCPTHGTLPRLGYVVVAR